MRKRFTGHPFFFYPEDSKHPDLLLVAGTQEYCTEFRGAVRPL